MARALIVDDDVSFRLGLADAVRREGLDVVTASSLAEARREIAAGVPDVILLDLGLPDQNGMDLLPELEALPEPLGVILVTGQATVETAVAALRHGVADYLTKPIDFARVKMALGNLTRTRDLTEEIGSLRGELRSLGRFGLMVGASPAMQRVYDLLARVGRKDATVLLVGETGTGKEVAAQTVHRLSRRHNEPFVAVNCGAVSASLIESELFGHERGSFTGADRMHRGVFEQAHRGTLFLDEVSEMPAELQVRLLRVLETGTLTRVGGIETVQVDVRVIAASNRRPEEAVAAGKLREDLLYRLNVFPITLPPLRERGDDVDLLANHFLVELNREEGTEKRFTPPALVRLRSHSWPGNVRELRNVVHRAFIVSDETIGADTLPLHAAPVAVAGGGEVEAGRLLFRPGTRIADVEKALIVATLDHFDQDKKRTAEALGISLKTLYNRLNEYGRGRSSLPPLAPAPQPRETAGA
ncbi:MAG TPA: sigma-54 dependent transcriptional regulator [Vicinamibacteria bacterium]|nr:sigma-54 dependent transcriptional regulator [Vicinamibacteria bacterium]